MIRVTKLLLIITSFIVVVLIGITIRIIWFPAHVALQSVDVAYGIVGKTLDVENALVNYEWFKRQIQSIESLHSKEKRAIEDVAKFKSILPNEREKWSREDKAEYDRLNSIATGLGNQLDDAIAEYEARASMVNRAIFKDDLPTNISRAILTGQQLIK